MSGLASTATPEQSGEQQLWRAVVEQSFRDLFRGNDHERNVAAAWLFSPVQKKDRDTAFSLAGIDQESLLREFSKVSSPLITRNME